MPDSANQTYLAFDFGTRSIGVAVGQSLTATASELTTLPANEGIPNWENVQSLLQEWRPAVVIVGLPTNMDGSDMEMTRRARKFGNRIAGRFNQTVEFFDERLTTREAKSEAAVLGHKGNYRDKPIDPIAARLILEGWMGANA
ncbi:putative Holliday junction resolvase [Alteromonadaceae bacterium 2753L.S.0a.02]|nr:putative Holliday junction resolvase [Alteromonadaceae bacterium 2753L.S.0a.02]